MDFDVETELTLSAISQIWNQFHAGDLCELDFIKPSSLVISVWVDTENERTDSLSPPKIFSYRTHDLVFEALSKHVSLDCNFLHPGICDYCDVPNDDVFDGTVDSG